MFSSTASGATRKPAKLGQDFGCLSSKNTLASKQPLTDATSVLRVTLTADRHHPERRTEPNASHSEFEFISYAALVNGRLVVGRQALGEDVRFPLKTAFAHCAGFPRRNVRTMPRGSELLRLCDRNLVTWEMLEEALLDHFRLLREMSLAKAEDAGLEITMINLTYPDFIWETEEDWDLSEKYQKYYQSLMRQLWGEDMPMKMTMEGHSTAVYVYEPFEDPLSSWERTRLWQRFSGLDLREGVNLVAVDSGSSTLNLQSSTLFFDENNLYKYSQTISKWSWKPGNQGGSHQVNDIIEDLVIPQLPGNLAPGTAVPGELACLMRHFEEKKWSLDYTQDDAPIILNGTVPEVSARLYPYQVRRAFDEIYGDSFTLIRQRCKHMINIGKPVVAVFCGGGFCNPGLQRQIEGLMSEMEIFANEQGVDFRHTILSDFDQNWASAVSTGAAVSVMRVPPPVGALRDSAIGLQRLERTRNGIWKGWSHADVLLRTGCGQPFTVDIDLGPAWRARTKFNLVCNPGYAIEDHRETETEWIKIGKENEVHHGPLTTYDLDWMIDGSALPRDRFRLCVGGHDAALIATNSLDSLGHRPIRLVFTCHAIDDKGTVTNSDNDRRWELLMDIHPYSKLLYVHKEKELPVWCSFCATGLSGVAETCVTCELHYCTHCWEEDIVPVGEHLGHETTTQSIGL